MTPVIGMDVRIDEKGRLQPWRIVVTTLEKPRRYSEYLMRLPGGLKYLTPPNHHVHGYLMQLPAEAEKAVKVLSAQVLRMGVSSAYAASAHLNGVASELLAWNGVNIIPVDVHMPHDATLDDPFGIGEESGHEIANIVRNLEKRK